MKNISEKYGDTFDTEKYRAKRAADQKRLEKDRLVMTHGRKKWKEFTKDALEAKKRVSKLRPGEVKKLNKKTGKWESNKK